MEYHHRQEGRFHFLLFLLSVILAVNYALFRDQESLGLILLVASFGMFVIGLSFMWLTIEDRGEFLAVRYGPLPFFRTAIRYDTITAVERGRSSPIDGWGIHYIPGRGWTYNIWGLDCVVVHQGNRIIRLGTDDVTGLAKFLRNRIAVAV